MHALPALLGAAAAMALASPAPDRHKTIDPASLPAPYATPSANFGPKMVPQPAGVMPTVPPGFEVNLFADGLQNSRWLVVAKNGDVFVAESMANQVRVLRDTDGDGKADVKQVFASGLDRPFGMAFHKDWFYVANTASIVRFKYKPGQLQAEGPPETVVSDIPGLGYRGHWTRDLVFNPKGTKMYVTIGSEVNIGEESDPKRATVMEYNPDGTGGRIFAEGLRNANGKAFNPRTGELWATVNERDGLGDDLVPDYFTSVRDGAHYGWPYYYAGKYHDPRVPEKPEIRAKVLTPDVLLTSHVAAMGVVFYTGKQFPKEYQGDALVALHGSGNRSKRVGYRVIRVLFKYGKPTGEWEDFLAGFMSGETAPEVWGRPTGVAIAADGSVLVTDDGTNRIWRVSYKK